MYQSPISIYETAMQTIMEQRENAIVAKVQDAFGVHVDKAELIRALKYDRGQYEAGYRDGKADAMAELVLCKDCKGWCTEEIAKHYGVDRYCTMTMMPTDADDFCSCGERRTEDGQ